MSAQINLIGANFGSSAFTSAVSYVWNWGYIDPNTLIYHETSQSYESAYWLIASSPMRSADFDDYILRSTDSNVSVVLSYFNDTPVDEGDSCVYQTTTDTNPKSVDPSKGTYFILRLRCLKSTGPALTPNNAVDYYTFSE